MPEAELKIGALGGSSTFGGEAADLFRQRYPEFGAVAYYDVVGSMFAAVEAGEIDAACVPEQTSRAGFHVRSQGRIAPPDSRWYVFAEVTHAYHCALLVNPGTSAADIRKVLGHTGSVSQSQSWLAENLPEVEIEIVDSNSLGAAQMVAEGDGSVASVGTALAAETVGLVEMAKDIDGGSLGHYWAIGAVRRFADNPTRWVVAGRFTGDDRLGSLLAAVRGRGLTLLTSYAQPSGRALFEYDQVLRLGGQAPRADIEAVLASFPETRLAGAFVSREEDIPA